MPRDQFIPSQPDAPTIGTIGEIIRKTAQEGARQLLQQALVAKTQQHLEQHRIGFRGDAHPLSSTVSPNT